MNRESPKIPHLILGRGVHVRYGLWHFLTSSEWGKFATQEELKEKVEQSLNSFEEFPVNDDIGGVGEEPFLR